MKLGDWSESLWGKQAKVAYLLGAAVLLLLSMLGSHEIWTQEHRWADIVNAMFYRHDYLHPYLNGTPYYDKPLLSYWLIVFVSWIMGDFSTWALRMPSALAGVLAVWSIYRLGTRLKNKSLGLLSGWLLLTTFYFIFWARTSSADMLNMAGALFAVSWYFDKKDQPTLFNYMIFFIILSLTALCKGLIGPIVAGIAIFPDLMMQQEWKKHLHVRVFVSMIPGVLIYLFPFMISSYVGGDQYGENGLYLVYRENILRYFQPFDHKGPLYTYFLFLPIYLMPWAVFFLPALWSVKSRWSSMSAQSKWVGWAVLLLFAFFTLSGSRRNYYVLSMVPFAILFTADWLLGWVDTTKHRLWVGRSVAFSFFFFLTVFAVLQPFYYAGGGLNRFARDVHQVANTIQPWSHWNVVMLDPESKVRFYLKLAPSVKNYSISGTKRSHQTEQTLLQTWPLLQNVPPNTIFITRKEYEPALRDILKHYRVVESQLGIGEKLVHLNDRNLPIAFIPEKDNI